MVAAGSLGALLVTVGCGAPRGAAVAAPAQATAAGQTGLPIVVSCEPTQRTIVRPTIVNGAAMSQVECVPGEGQQAAAYAQPFVQAPPVAQAQQLVTPVTYRTSAPQPVVYRDMADAEVLPVSRRSSSAGPVRARQVVYDEPRAERRSVKKSAVIIGSSAGVGAGVGAAVGGRKGALLGAAIGGGGAAVWDQITRRKN
jgi:hypothetical protein